VIFAIDSHHNPRNISTNEENEAGIANDDTWICARME
jgi:hypothetical protein